MQLGTQEIARPSISKRTFSVGEVSKLFHWFGCPVFVEENEILDTVAGLNEYRWRKTWHRIHNEFRYLMDGDQSSELLMEQWDPETMDALLLCVAPENAVGRTGKKGDFSIGDDNVITRGGIYTYASCQIIKSQIVRDFSQTVFHLTQFGTT